MIRHFINISIILALVAPLKAISKEEIVKIGVAVPLTGSISHLGKDIEAGVRLAIDRLNAERVSINGKNYKFVAIVEDDQSDPRVATQVAQRLVDSAVVAVIGHYNSGTTIPASRIYAKAGIPQITPGSTNPMYTQQGISTAYRIIANDDQQISTLSSFAFNKLKARNAIIIDDRTAAGQGQADLFARMFQEKGGNIIGRQYTTNSAVDFMGILTKIRSQKPDLIFYGGMDAQAGPMAKQMAQLGMKTRLLGADGMQSSLFTRLAGTAAEGHLASSVGMPKEKLPGYHDFNKLYSAKYGDMHAYSPYSYDATMVIVDAMRRAGSVDPKIYAKMISTTNYKGITGNIKFDMRGDIEGGAITVYEVKNGRWQSLD